jgi:hypothetical protein
VSVNGVVLGSKAILAMALAATLVLLIAVLENIRTRGRRLSRVLWLTRTDRGLISVANRLSPTSPPGSSVQMFNEMFAVYEVASVVTVQGRGFLFLLTERRLRCRPYIAALIKSLLLPKRTLPSFAVREVRRSADFPVRRLPSK